MVWTFLLVGWRKLCVVLLACWCLTAQGQDFAWEIEDLPDQSLGRYLQVLRDFGGTWSVQEARQRFQDSNPPPARDEVLSFGIGSPTVWLRLPLHNAQRDTVRRHLLLGTTWLDRADVFVVRGGQEVQRVTLGDETPYTHGVVPGMGYVWELDFAPKRTELLVRLQSVDPLLLPLQLLDAQTFAIQRDTVLHSYELIFGALFALMLYNLVLFAVARNHLHARYAIYIGSMLLLILTYTGKGLGLWWPESPGFQRYVILCSMLLFNMAGLNFAVHFLQLRRHLPRVGRWLLAAQWGTATFMVLLVLGDRHLWAVWWAFGVFLVCMGLLFAFGLWAARSRQLWSGTFLTAVTLSMAGAASAWLVVVGVVGYSTLQFRVMEVGFLVDAVLLAIALGRKVAQRDAAQYEAQA